MKQAVWGYAVLVLGVIAIMITWFFAQVTNTDQHNYNLLKETVENAMYDAVDLSAYRKDGTVRIDETKFVESFVRRFAENADLSNTYQVDIYDVNEVPPKVSLSVNSCKQANGTTCTNSAENLTFTISNKIDAILEAEWVGKQATDLIVNYDAGGVNLSYDKKTFKQGDSLTLPSLNPEGAYKNIHWKDSSGNEYVAGTTLINGLTLTATFDSITYTITYNANGGTGAPAVQNKKYGATVTLSTVEPTKTNAKFTGWKGNDGKTYQKGDKYAADNNLTLTAQWQATIKCDGGQYYNGSICASCTKGSYCSGGTYNKNDTKQGIKACPNGYTSDESAKAQSKCYISVAAGKYLKTVNTTTTASCTKGTYKAKHNVYYGSTSSCSKCSQGTYNTTTGNSSCATCPAGSYCTGGSNITSCGSGKTSAAGSTSSSACKDTMTKTFISGDLYGGAPSKAASMNGISSYKKCNTSPVKCLYVCKTNDAKDTSTCEFWSSGAVGSGSKWKWFLITEGGSL